MFFARNREEIARSVGISGGASLGIFGFGIDLGFEHLDRQTQRSSTTFAVIRISFDAPSRSLVDYRLQDDAATALRRDGAHKFYERCGDGFVSAVRSGGLFLGIVALEESAEEEVRRLAGNGGVSFFGFGVKGGASREASNSSSGTGPALRAAERRRPERLGVGERAADHRPVGGAGQGVRICGPGGRHGADAAGGTPVPGDLQPAARGPPVELARTTALPRRPGRPPRRAQGRRRGGASRHRRERLQAPRRREGPPAAARATPQRSRPSASALRTVASTRGGAASIGA
ncbi:hypothetical protein [Nannocystis pusilla]|uniref:hypothetical protein n=1 Tax=Nannocystis pusilla TaxID=889268 RepID=UPI003B77253E